MYKYNGFLTMKPTLVTLDLHKTQ